MQIIYKKRSWMLHFYIMPDWPHISRYIVHVHVLYHIKSHPPLSPLSLTLTPQSLVTAGALGPYLHVRYVLCIKHTCACARRSFVVSCFTDTSVGSGDILTHLVGPTARGTADTLINVCVTLGPRPSGITQTPMNIVTL